MNTPDLQQGLQTALALHQGGQIDQAIKLYEAIIGIDPGHADALHLLGVARHQTGDSETGVTLIRKAIARSRKRPEFHSNLGQALEAVGRPAEAEKAYRQALALDRDMTDALSNLGAILLARGRTNDAIRALSKAVKLDPNHGTARMNLGNAKRADGAPGEAVELHRDAARLMPSSDKAWVNLATSLMDLQELDDAQSALKRSLTLSPALIESLNNLGFLYINQPDYGRAARCFTAAINTEPRYAAPHAGMAEVHFLQDRAEAALEHSARALELTPNDPQIQSRRSIQLLTMGRVREGWVLRDARLETKGAIEHRRRPPRWTGEPLAGRSLLVTAEEGIGDEILFASCFRDAIANTGNCVLECDARLLDVFRRSFPEATVEAVRRSGDRFKPVQDYGWLPKNPPIDLAIESGSLFQHFRPNLDAYATVGPYLIADDARVTEWRARLDALAPGLKVGFSWRSKELSRFRNSHYTTLDDWSGLFQVPGARFISMQYGNGWAEEIAEATDRLGCEITVFEDADLSDDFETIFALSEALDLIICPSSTVSWVGGALGKPTWVVHLRPNFTRLGTDHFPGFPSMRGFPKGVLEPWSVCFEPVRDALIDQIAQTRSGDAP
jgi:tetratricopeptide (TPR) repeat protein